MRLLKHISLAMLVIVTPFAGAELTARRIEKSIVLEANAAMERGAGYLRDAQLPNGSWANHPVFTSLAAVALANLTQSPGKEELSVRDSALDYIVGQARANGAIRNRRSKQYPLYSTAMSMLALVRWGRPQDMPVLQEARAYLKRAQVLELSTDHPTYGGFAVRDGVPPSLTISQWVLEALYLTDYLEQEEAEAAEVYDRALIFIRRCQNLKQNTDGELVRGCFQDFPTGCDESYEVVGVAGTPRSTAFLTAIGLKSLLYARSPRQSPRVQSALRCLQDNYTVAENPGLSEKGLYTYLFALSKALRSLGCDIISGPGGTEHFWRQELVLALLGRQYGDGSWRHAESAWWENHPELTTAYALMILTRCVEPERVISR